MYIYFPTLIIYVLPFQYVGAHGTVYLASVEGLPTYHPSDIGQLTERSLGFRGLSEFNGTELAQYKPLSPSEKEEKKKRIFSAISFQSMCGIMERWKQFYGRILLSYLFVLSLL